LLAADEGRAASGEGVCSERGEAVAAVGGGCGRRERASVGNRGPGLGHTRGVTVRRSTRNTHAKRNRRAGAAGRAGARAGRASLGALVAGRGRWRVGGGVPFGRDGGVRGVFEGQWRYVLTVGQGACLFHGGQAVRLRPSRRTRRQKERRRWTEWLVARRRASAACGLQEQQAWAQQGTGLAMGEQGARWSAGMRRHPATDDVCVGGAHTKACRRPGVSWWPTYGAIQQRGRAS